MSGNVGSVIFGSGIVENVGVAVGIASLTLSAQLLFPLPVFTSGSWPMSGHVSDVTPRSGVVENVREAVEVSFVVVTQA